MWRGSCDTVGDLDATLKKVGGELGRSNLVADLEGAPGACGVFAVGRTGISIRDALVNDLAERSPVTPASEARVRVPRTAR